MSMAKKYGALSFDPDDTRDALAERGRRLLVDTAMGLDAEAVSDGEHLQYLVAGLLVGIVQIAAAHSQQTDEDWASIRAGTQQMLPWAVDQARSIVDLPPLADV